MSRRESSEARGTTAVRATVGAAAASRQQPAAAAAPLLTTTVNAAPGAARRDPAPPPAVDTIPAASAATRRDPGTMAKAEVLAELGALLAAGWRRALSRRKALDDREQVEAACDQRVDAAESGMEVA